MDNTHLPFVTCEEREAEPRGVIVDLRYHWVNLVNVGNDSGKYLYKPFIITLSVLIMTLIK